MFVDLTYEKNEVFQCPPSKPGFFCSSEGSGTAASASTVPVLSGICSSVPVAYRFEKDGYYRESRMNLKP